MSSRCLLELREHCKTGCVHRMRIMMDRRVSLSSPKFGFFVTIFLLVFSRIGLFLALGGNGDLAASYGPRKPALCNENYDFSVPAHCYEGRHLGNLSGRRKRYFTFKVSYYPNADASFQIQNIITSGDIALNPGPTNSTVKCSVCGKTVARNHRAVECDACSLWCHIKCGKVNAKTYIDMMNTSQLQWTCPVCLTNLQSNACLTNLQPTASASEMPVRANCQDSEIDVYKMLRSIRAARLIHKLPKGMTDEDILARAGWMPLEYFYKFRILMITHKAFYNLGLEEINSLVVRTCKSYNLRKSLNILVNRPNTELGRNSFVHRAAIAWNSLSDSVRSFSNQTGFKNGLKQLKHTVMNITFEKDSSVVYNKHSDFYYY